MRPTIIKRRFPELNRHRFLGPWGAVSDDTEQTALVAAALAGAEDIETVRRRFRQAMLGWFLRLPFGIGFGTLRACIKLLLGFRVSGVHSAGNGAAMRTSIIGVAIPDDERRQVRLELSAEVARVTHTDPRAVMFAAFCAEMGAVCARGRAPSTAPQRRRFLRAAGEALPYPELHNEIDRALELAESEVSVSEAAAITGTSGFVVESVPFAAFCFARFGDNPMRAIEATIRGGGDTDTNAAIVGAWVGALHGADALPQHLLARIVGGPFGPKHLRAIGAALAEGRDAPGFSFLIAWLRNLAFMPVVLAHGFRRLIPF